jgi:hypothetical protein
MNTSMKLSEPQTPIGSRLRLAETAAELLGVEHPHIGRVEAKSRLKVLWGIATGGNYRLDSMAVCESGERTTVALNVLVMQNSRLLLTIGRSFVLLTIQEGASRIPVILKSWTRVGRERPIHPGIDFACDTYVDTDGMKWLHRYGWRGMSDTLTAMDASGNPSFEVGLQTPGA